MPQVMFAAYVQAGDGNKNFRGEETYAGKSDGLARQYFGSSQADADRIVEAARAQRRDYRLDRITYDRPGLNSDVLECKTVTLKVWPTKTTERVQK